MIDKSLWLRENAVSVISSSSFGIEVQIEGDVNEGRFIEITDYDISPQVGPSWGSAGGDPGYPAEVENVEVCWQDTKKELTSDEWDKYVEPNIEEIDDMIFRDEAARSER
jgi:hypothetical protein